MGQIVFLLTWISVLFCVVSGRRRRRGGLLLYEDRSGTSEYVQVIVCLTRHRKQLGHKESPYLYVVTCSADRKVSPEPAPIDMLNSPTDEVGSSCRYRNRVDESIIQCRLDEHEGHVFLLLKNKRR